MAKNKENLVPKEVCDISETLKKAGFEAYLVGGCVRDLLLGRKPRDWDIATDAKPEEIEGLFEHTFYENVFGTVGIVNDETKDETLKTVEVTTYRREGPYRDRRRPEKVEFGETIEEDLKRRDFTVNAIAAELSIGHADISKGHFVDLYKGQKDIKDKVLRTVGDPDERFSEDALRMLRTVRLSAELGFDIEEKTADSIRKNSDLLGEISEERIRDEFVRIIMSESPKKGLEAAQQLNILRFISPQLEKGLHVEQTATHKYDVFEHLLRTVQAAADKNYPLEIRLAALFHDIAKPMTRRKSEEKGKYTFYGHDVVGARVTRKTLEKLKFPKNTVDKVTKLVRWHMFFSDTEEITHTAVRRLIRNVGGDNVWDIIDLRIADRIGTGRPKEEPYRLRKYQAMMEEVMRDPVSVSKLEIDGNRIMKVADLKPGPRVGFILHALLEEVIENPKLNDSEYLEKRAVELSKLPENELGKLGEKGKSKKEVEEGKEIEEIRRKYHVE